MVFKTNYRLMQVKVLQNAPRGAILLTFIKLPLSLNSLFCLFRVVVLHRCQQTSNHVVRKLQEPSKNLVIAGVNESMLSRMPLIVGN